MNQTSLRVKLIADETVVCVCVRVHERACVWREAFENMKDLALKL